MRGSAAVTPVVGSPNHGMSTKKKQPVRGIMRQVSNSINMAKDGAVKAGLVLKRKASFGNV